MVLLVMDFGLPWDESVSLVLGTPQRGGQLTIYFPCHFDTAQLLPCSCLHVQVARAMSLSIDLYFVCYLCSYLKKRGILFLSYQMCFYPSSVQLFK